MNSGQSIVPGLWLGLLLSSTVQAGPLTTPNNFTAGTPAVAGEVNENFEAVATSVNDNDSRIAVLEAEIVQLRADLNNVLSVNQYLSLQMVNDQPAIRITGANLQIVNGLDATASSNGTGNLLLGYDELRIDNAAVCSIGTNPNDGTPITDEAQCTAVGGIFAVNHKTGSHYLVVGRELNYSRWGGIVAGRRNTSNYDYASVSGGNDNRASGRYSNVSGGFNNVAGGQSSSVSGGITNTASGIQSHISGGISNTASGIQSNISGGSNNTGSGNRSSVSGGASRSAPGVDDWVAGGLSQDN